MNRKINIRPTTGVYQTYKNQKYDPWSAIAEFVDNSTQSYYDNISKLESTKYWKGLNISIEYKKDNELGDCLIIKDNAYGMNFYDFKRAIVLDSPPPKATRSEFGMGLKMAACWFGRKWRVESTELGSNIKYITNVDIESLAKYKNEEIEVEEVQCNPKEHGTTITIWNLNRKITGRQIGKTKDQLRGMYRSDIRNGQISIYYNGEKLYYEEPKVLVEELADGNKKVWKKEVDFIVENGDQQYKVYGFIALRETASVSSAGFALLRRGRVIIGGYENTYRPEEVFEKSNSFIYQRLFGELNLDEWPVTQTKDAFDWYSGLEDELINKLKEECVEYRKKAKVYRKNDKIKIAPSIESLVDKFTKAGIINKPEIKDLPNELESKPKKLTSEKEAINDNSLESISNKQSNNIEIIGESGKKIKFECGEATYIFNLVLSMDDPNKNWLYISTNNNEYTIEWNIRHPFFKPYIDDADFLSIMEQFIFAFSLAEIEAANTGINHKIEPSDIRMSMNDMLKKVIYGGE